MQRAVVKIVHRYLAEGYDDHSEEIEYMGSWAVLVGYPPGDNLLRAMAREIVEVIRGVDQADLVRVPTEDEAVRFLLDHTLGELGDPENEEARDFAEYHAECLIKWLRDLHTHLFWRGKRLVDSPPPAIRKEGSQMYCRTCKLQHPSFMNHCVVCEKHKSLKPQHRHFCWDFSKCPYWEEGNLTKQELDEFVEWLESQNCKVSPYALPLEGKQ